MTINELIKTLLEVRNQTHLWHWQTQSFAEHSALGAFYDTWLDLTDKFVETYSGKYGRPSGGFNSMVMGYAEGAPLAYLTRIAALMESEAVRSIAPDTDLQNILDELTAEAQKTCYLLTLK